MTDVNELLEDITVIKRNGKKVDFDGSKIALAIKKGFDSVEIDDDESEKERIRGVSVGRVLSVLLHKGLVEERGRMNIPGRPILYGTTQLFLKCTGLSDVHELREKWNSLPKEGQLF